MNILKRLYIWRITTYRNLRSRYVNYQDRKRTERADKKRVRGLLPDRNAVIVIPPTVHVSYKKAEE